MTWGWYFISASAARWIVDEMNHPNNRRKKLWKIGLMVEDIKNGRWRETHQGIAFDTDGWLVDGQNRLEAIAESGIGVVMMVCFDVPKEGVPVFDTGSVRSVSDGARMSGMVTITHLHVAIARRMKDGNCSKVPVSNQVVIDYIEEHIDAIEFAIRSFGGKRRGICIAPIYAVVARAWYTHDRVRLSTFCKQLKSGEQACPRDDQAMVTLRNCLLEALKNKSYGGVHGTIIYEKAEQALMAYLAKRTIKRLTGTGSEQFPIPGDVNQDNAVDGDQDLFDE